MTKRSEQLWIAAGVAAFALLAAGLSWELNVWQDEIYTLDTTAAGPRRAAQRAVTFELQPPLYFAALAVWREAHSSLFWSRAFSALAVAGAIGLWIDVARKLAPHVPSWAVLALAATAYPLLWAASEARCYGLVAFWTAAIVWTWQRGYVAEPPSQAAKVGLVLAGIGGLYTQYYLGFVLVGCAVGLAAAAQWRPLAGYLLAMAVVAAALAPLLPWLPSQIEGHGARSLAGPHDSVLTAIRETYWRVQDYVLPLSERFREDATWIAVRDWVTRAGVVAALAAAVVYRRRLPRHALGLLVALCGCFVVLRSIVGPDYFGMRYTLALLLPAQLAALALLFLPRRPALAALGTALLAAAGAAASIEQFAPLAKQGDWRRVAQYLQAKDSESAVIVFANLGQAPLERYYQGTGAVVPLPAALVLERYEPAASVLDSVDAIVQRIAAAAAPGKRFWVVVAHANTFQGIDKHAERLEAALAQETQVLPTRTFHGATVRLFEKSNVPEATRQ